MLIRNLLVVCASAGLLVGCGEVNGLKENLNETREATGELRSLMKDMGTKLDKQLEYTVGLQSTTDGMYGLTDTIVNNSRTMYCDMRQGSSEEIRRGNFEVVRSEPSFFLKLVGAGKYFNSLEYQLIDQHRYCKTPGVLYYDAALELSRSLLGLLDMFGPTNGELYLPDIVRDLRCESGSDKKLCERYHAMDSFLAMSLGMHINNVKQELRTQLEGTNPISAIDLVYKALTMMRDNQDDYEKLPRWVLELVGGTNRDMWVYSFRSRYNVLVAAMLFELIEGSPLGKGKARKEYIFDVVNKPWAVDYSMFINDSSKGISGVGAGQLFRTMDYIKMAVGTRDMLVSLGEDYRNLATFRAGVKACHNLSTETIAPKLQLLQEVDTQFSVDDLEGATGDIELSWAAGLLEDDVKNISAAVVRGVRSEYNSFVRNFKDMMITLAESIEQNPESVDWCPFNLSTDGIKTIRDTKEHTYEQVGEEKTLEHVIANMQARIPAEMLEKASPAHKEKLKALEKFLLDLKLHHAKK